MVPRKTRQFLFENQDAFIRLSEIIKEVDTVRENRFDKYPVEVRRLAIELLETWIKNEFALSGEDVKLPVKDVDNIYRRLEKGDE